MNNDNEQIQLKNQKIHYYDYIFKTYIHDNYCQFINNKIADYFNISYNKINYFIRTIIKFNTRILLKQEFDPTYQYYLNCKILLSNWNNFINKNNIDKFKETFKSLIFKILDNNINSKNSIKISKYYIFDKDDFEQNIFPNANLTIEEIENFISLLNDIKSFMIYTKDNIINNLSDMWSNDLKTYLLVQIN